MGLSAFASPDNDSQAELEVCGRKVVLPSLEPLSVILQGSWVEVPMLLRFPADAAIALWAHQGNGPIPLEPDTAWLVDIPDFHTCIALGRVFGSVCVASVTSRGSELLNRPGIIQDACRHVLKANAGILGLINLSETTDYLLLATPRKCITLEPHENVMMSLDRQAELLIQKVAQLEDDDAAART